MMTPSTALKSAGVMMGYLDLEVPEACILPRISSERVSRLVLAYSPWLLKGIERKGKEGRGDVQDIRPHLCSCRFDSFDDCLGELLDMPVGRVENYCDDRFGPSVNLRSRCGQLT
jgi:hypothetical protein